ncbi:MAG TPA: hypothetical protein ENG35_07645 [Desulfobacteraceae bacterium]|nr:hypothetical protein [Desulfobacteraceae bacterium]
MSLLPVAIATDGLIKGSLTLGIAVRGLLRFQEIPTPDILGHLSIVDIDDEDLLDVILIAVCYKLLE